MRSIPWWTGLAFSIMTLVPGLNISAQGYIVLNSGDTIDGRISVRLKYIENNPAEIKFTTTDGSAVIYKAGEIRGFGHKVPDFDEGFPPIWEDYVTMPSFKKGVPVFYHRLLGGRITVYHNRSSAQTTVTKSEGDTRFDGIGFTFVPGEGLTIGPRFVTSYRIIEARTRYSSYYIRKDNGPITRIDKDNFDSYHQELFGDCPAIAGEVEKNPDLRKFKNFMLLSEIYNNICN